MQVMSPPVHVRCMSAQGRAASQIPLKMCVSSGHCDAETSWHLGVNSMLDVFCLERLLVQAEVCAVLHEVLRQCWHIAPLEDVPHCTRTVNTAGHTNIVCTVHMPGRRSYACHDRFMFQSTAIDQTAIDQTERRTPQVNKQVAQHIYAAAQTASTLLRATSP